MLSFLIMALAGGFVVGGLARFAVPGPDPMPAWMTIGIGIAGSVVGGVLARALLDSTEGALVFSFAAAILLVIAYRRYVQKRPITGPRAHERPARGVGVRRLRRGVGGPTEKTGRDAEGTIEQLTKLGQLRDAGVITPEEFETKKAELLARI